MSFAEFVGGPWDGRLELLADVMTDVHVPLLEPVAYVGANPFASPVAMPVTLRYRREGRRANLLTGEWLDAPTGEPVYRYVLDTPV